MAEEKTYILALFDFDGTLTRKDTFIELIKFIHGKSRFYTGLLVLLPYLFLFKIKIIPNWKVKEKVLTYFFNGTSADDFGNDCDRFATQKIPHLLRKGAINRINELKAQGANIVVVSASLEDWVQPWCNVMGIACIASKPEIEGGKLTGRLSGKNCYGMEKVHRVKESIGLSKYSVIYVFGDSRGDLPMMELATVSYYKPFR